MGKCIEKSCRTERFLSRKPLGELEHLENYYYHNDNCYCVFHAPEDVKQVWSLENVVEFESLCVNAIKQTDGTILSHTIFPDGFSLENKQFTNIILTNCKFMGDNRFLNLHVSNELDFSYSTFENIETSFKGMVVANDARFDGCTFPTKTSFERCSLRKASFRNVLFSSVSFADASIQEADFTDSRIEGNFDFSTTRESKEREVHFFPATRAKFNGERTDFSGRIFLKDISFSDASFKAAPEFHTCTISQDVTFPPESHFHDKSGNAANAYSTLKLHMAAMKRPYEEAMFYALEQKALQNHFKIDYWVRNASKAYGLISDYGRSFMRPLAWIVGLATFFCFVAYAPIWHSDFGSLKDAAALSLKQVLFPLFSLRDGIPAEIPMDLSHGMRLGLTIVAGFQSILSAALLALFFLALRWTFKRP